MDQQVILAQLYNLILNPATRDFERANLLAAKQALESSQRLGGVLDKLIGDLRPLGARGNLTPDVMDFYLMITGAAPVVTANKARNICKPRSLQGDAFGVWWSHLIHNQELFQ